MMLAEPRAADGQMTITAPYDRAPIATVDLADDEAVQNALATAHQLFRDRDQWLPVRQRIEVLQRAADMMRSRIEDLALHAAREGGKPLVDSRVEAHRAVSTLASCAETLKSQVGNQIPMNIDAASAHRFAFTIHEPIGVVLAFSAFNHPLNLIAHQVGPAIAAGCPVIVKPAEATPISCMRLVTILREAGLPDAWCQALLTTGNELNGKMVADPRVAFFNFIGSAKVGWMLRAGLPPGARCALEHGGAAPVVVCADADLEEALPLLVKGGFYHAGQVCVSVQRVLAHEKIAESLAARVATAASGLVVGDPTSPETQVGPLIRPAEVRRVHQWVTEAVDGGAKILCGGNVISETCYAPTVLYNPPADAKVSTEEIFGPVVCVYPCSDIDAAIEQANSLPFSFQAAVFTRDLNQALRVSNRLDAAAVMVNDHTAFRVDWMPFGGQRISGLGVGGPPQAIPEMQIEKLVVVRSNEL